MPFLNLVQRVSQITITVCCVQLITRSVVRILLVCRFLQQTEDLTHHRHKQSLLCTGLFICKGLNRRLVEMSTVLCSHIFRTVFVSLDRISLISTEWEWYFLFVSSRDTISNKVLGPSTVTLMSCKRPENAISSARRRPNNLPLPVINELIS